MQDLLSVARVCDADLSQVLILHYIAPLRNETHNVLRMSISKTSSDQFPAKHVTT